jgi:hypothetical protein
MLLISMFKVIIRKELLSRINQIYYKRTIFITRELYDYLQFNYSDLMENYVQKIMKGPTKLSVAH